MAKHSEKTLLAHQSMLQTAALLIEAVAASHTTHRKPLEKVLTLLQAVEPLKATTEGAPEPLRPAPPLSSYEAD